MKFAVAFALLASVDATRISALGDPDYTPEKLPKFEDSVSWDPTTLPPCPGEGRTVMDDGKTHVTKYPYVGATCIAQLSSAVPTEDLIMTTAAFDPWALEHCPDFDERFTLTDGKTRAVPYPKKGYNCHSEWALPQQSFDPMSMEHCPDFDERFTLTDGKTRAIPYPRKGYNCNNEWALVKA